MNNMEWELRICGQYGVNVGHIRRRQNYFEVSKCNEISILTHIFDSEGSNFADDIQTTFVDNILNLWWIVFQSIVHIGSSNALAPNNGLT